MFLSIRQKKNPKTNTLIDRFLLHLQRSPHAVRFSLGTNGWVGTYIYIKGVTERFGFDAVRISQVQTSCQKTKQRERPKGVFICKPLMYLVRKVQRVDYI